MIALVEAFMLAVFAALHFGIVWHVGRVTFAAPFLYPMGIIDAVLALALLLAVVLPGGGNVRAGRVLAAQVLVVIGVFASQVALLRGTTLTTAHTEIFYGLALLLSLGSIVLVASPMYRRRPLTR